MNELVYKNSEGKPVTNSLLVAGKFGKRHADVIRAIENVISQSTEIQSQRNFALSEYTDATGKSNPVYIMTRDLSFPLRSNIDREEGYYVITNEPIDITGTGKTHEEAILSFGEEFDFLYSRLNTLDDTQLSKRMFGIKNLLFGRHVKREQSFERTIALQKEMEELRDKPDKTGDDFDRYLTVQRELKREVAIRKSLTIEGLSGMRSLF